MKRRFLLLFLLPAYAGSAQIVADTLPPVGLMAAPEKEAGKKIWLHAGLALGYVGATYYCYRKEDNHFQKESQEHRHPLKDVVAHSLSPLGTGENHWMAVGVTTGLAYLSRNTRLQKTVFIWAGSLLMNDVATNRLKGHFQRYRPSTGMPFNTFDGRDGPGANRSLPSAHASNAFATATVFATLYKDRHWVAPFAYGMAAMVSFSRVYNNAHWASDIMAGAAVGFMSAKVMIATDKWLTKKNIRLYPQVGNRNASIGMVKTF